MITNSTQGNIVSPGYPNDYPNQVNCSWKLEIAEGLKLRINVLDVEVEVG